MTTEVCWVCNNLIQEPNPVFMIDNGYAHDKCNARVNLIWATEYGSFPQRFMMGANSDD